MVVPVDPTPDPVTPPPPVTQPDAPDYAQNKTPHLTQFGQYLLHEHMGDFQNLASGAIDFQELLNRYPTTADGHLAIGGDDELEQRLGLDDTIRAVQVGDQVQTRYDPYQSTDIKEQMMMHQDSSHSVLM